jgi:hypothetical protein
MFDDPSHLRLPRIMALLSISPIPPQESRLVESITRKPYDRVCEWIMRTIEGGGAQIRLGAHLASVFERAGLSRPTLRLESVIASGPAAIDAIQLVADLVATQLPNMECMGIVKASEVQLPTLTQRILAEVGADGTLVGRAEVAAWTTV